MQTLANVFIRTVEEARRILDSGADEDTIHALIFSSHIEGTLNNTGLKPVYTHLTLNKMLACLNFVEACEKRVEQIKLAYAWENAANAKTEARKRKTI